MRRFLPLGLTLFFSRPDADNSDGGWTDHTGGTSLYAAIDDPVVDDGDYIQSSDDPANDICKISLANPGVTPGMPFTVRYRGMKSGPGTMELRARLLQGTTEIASWTESDISSTPTTFEHTLTQLQFDAITNFDDLFIELRANAT
jgi:hypothetical protein